MQKENTVVIKKESFDYLALGGRGWHVVPGEGGAVVGQASPALQPCGAGSDNAPAKVHTSHVILNLFQDLHRFFPTRAFTLIELLVVVLIIGILTAVAVPQYKRAKLRTLFNITATTTKEIYNAQRLYFLANNQYTYSLEDLSIDIKDKQVLMGQRISCMANYYGPSCFLWKGNNPNNPQYLVWILYRFSDNQRGRLYCYAYPQETQETFKSFCSELTGDKEGTDVGHSWQYKASTTGY